MVTHVNCGDHSFVPACGSACKDSFGCACMCGDVDIDTDETTDDTQGTDSAEQTCECKPCKPKPPAPIVEQVPSYTFYADDFHGELSEDVFNANINKAVAFVRQLCGDKRITPATQTAFFRAVCAVVDAFAQYGTTPQTGFSVGSFTVQSGGSNASTGYDIAREGALLELAGTGLSYAGLA